MTNDKPVLVIGGYGPGLGKGLATVFEKAGYEIVTLSRSGSVYPGAFNITCDLTDENEVNQNFMEIMHRFGKIDVYIHNVFALHVGGFLDTSTKQFEQLWADTVKSAFHVTQQIIPQMLQHKSGVILFSGATAAIRGGSNFSAFASAKFALRGFSQSLAREYQSSGIHIAHVILDGLMFGTQSIDRFGGSKETALLPEDVANQYLQIVNQPSSCWSLELDLRPSTEGF